MNSKHGELGWRKRCCTAISRLLRMTSSGNQARLSRLQNLSVGKRLRIFNFEEYVASIKSLYSFFALFYTSSVCRYNWISGG